MLKIPVLAYQAANRDEGKLLPKGQLLRALLFYYRLKSLTIEGAFGGKRWVAFIQQRTGIAIKTIYKGFLLLAKAGLARREPGRLNLVSYDALFRLLGISVRGKGGAKLLRIPVTGNLLNQWQVAEIREALTRQRHALETNHANFELNRRDTDKNPGKAARRAAMRGYNRLAKLKAQLTSIPRLGKFKVNYDLTLSCAAVADLFGYVSAATGHEIEQRLQQAGKLKAQRRFVKIAMVPENKPHYRLPKSFYITRGCLIKQIPNLLTVL
ncbi:hypothetical protein [Solirubrum puertoriconensis]|uniref:hypothetical protein n=1 Tax=Solirubrum puertoriconensis TaxID=1751427 RepID=UPI00122E7819|nr:hypothetical protein [Solirubrum puertoriconensis]